MAVIPNILRMSVRMGNEEEKLVTQSEELDLNKALLGKIPRISL